MNIIREQRENIIENNNTAQYQLKGFLENMNKSLNQIFIRDSLHGDLDFSVLTDYGIQNITEISLEKGEITSISNLPDSLLSFICPENLLIELNDIPRSIQKIEVPRNHIQTIDLKNMPKLKTLDLNNNKITNIENISTSLYELDCASNNITSLNLLGLTHLRKLNVSNNPIHIIENLPEGVVEMYTDNTPSIEFLNSPIINIKQQDDTPKNLNYDEFLKEYFRIKNEYETKAYKQKKKVFEKTESKKAAKKKIQTLQPPCITCKRLVGSRFAKKDNRYIAICGDSTSPCKLDIQIYAGVITPLSYMLYLFKEGKYAFVFGRYTKTKNRK